MSPELSPSRNARWHKDLRCGPRSLDGIHTSTYRRRRCRRLSTIRPRSLTTEVFATIAPPKLGRDFRCCAHADPTSRRVRRRNTHPMLSCLLRVSWLLVWEEGCCGEPPRMHPPIRASRSSRLCRPTQDATRHSLTVRRQLENQHPVVQLGEQSSDGKPLQHATVTYKNQRTAEVLQLPASPVAESMVGWGAAPRRKVMHNSWWGCAATLRSVTFRNRNDVGWAPPTVFTPNSGTVVGGAHPTVFVAKHPACANRSDNRPFPHS